MLEYSKPGAEPIPIFIKANKWGLYFTVTNHVRIYDQKDIVFLNDLAAFNTPRAAPINLFVGDVTVTNTTITHGSMGEQQLQKDPCSRCFD